MSQCALGERRKSMRRRRRRREPSPATTSCCGWNNVAFHTVRSLVLLLVSMSSSRSSSLQGDFSRRGYQPPCLAFAFSSSRRHAPIRAFGGASSSSHIQRVAAGRNTCYHVLATTLSSPAFSEMTLYSSSSSSLSSLPFSSLSQKQQRSGASLARRERLKARQSQALAPTTTTETNVDDDEKTSVTKKKRKRCSWMERYEQLKDYIAIHGSANVPTQHPELGIWVKAQRVHYNLLCKRHHPTNNPTPISSSSLSSDGTSMGKQQRNRPNPLTPEKIDLLNQVDFIWDKQQHSWDTNVAQLVEFKEREGHLNVPQNYGALGRWVQTQRSEYTRYHNSQNDTSIKTTMTPERLKQLEDLNFVFHASEYNFKIMLEKLKRYKQDHGHIFVQHRDGSLGEWYYSRRKEYKRHILGAATPGAEGGEGTRNSPLTPHQIKALEDVGFSPSMLEPRPKRTRPKEQQQQQENTSSSSLQPSWDIRWDELKEFWEEFGNANVPRSSGGLGRWVGHQRYQKTLKDRGAPSSLTDDKEARLNELEFIWNVFDWQWDQKLLQLQTFQQTHGHTNVPQSSKKSDEGFGAWVQSQRNHYRLFQQQQQQQSNDSAMSLSSSLPSSYRITPERIAKLESIGFEWVVSKNNNNNSARKTIVRASLSPNNGEGNARKGNLGRASNGIKRRQSSSKDLVDDVNARDSNEAIVVEQDRTAHDILMEDENREWWTTLQELTQWRDQYGNFDLLLSPTSDLGLWALRQRTRYRVWLRQNEERHPNASQTFPDDRRQALTNAGLFDDICMW